ncbi:MAG TPA: hypothetical protein VJ487_02665 [Alphaproteobacteria bacterium]|nr:hypothetical protein [Alphaproteobacteria bacterium]
MDPRPKKNILRDDNDNPVYDKKGHVIEIPPGEDPHFFIEQGLLDRMRTGGVPNEEELRAMARILMSLIKFGQGGPWDSQRIKGVSVPEFVDYATIAIGLYGAAAGIPIETLFAIQDNYAWIMSQYPKGTVYDETYTHLPERNVGNTELGYELYKSGKISPSKK